VREIFTAVVSRDVVLTLCFTIFMASQVCAACLYFEHRQEKTGVKLIKTVGHLFCQIVNLDVFGCLQKFNNPLPTSQVRFHQFRVILNFCVEGSNKRSDCGALY